MGGVFNLEFSHKRVSARLEDFKAPQLVVVQ